MRQPDSLRVDQRAEAGPYLSVSNLVVKFPSEDGVVNAVEGGRGLVGDQQRR